MISSIQFLGLEQRKNPACQLIRKNSKWKGLPRPVPSDTGGSHMDELQRESENSEKGLARFSITARLLMVVGLLCLAYPFLIFLLVIEQNRAIDFANKEILGAGYLDQGIPVLISLTQRDLGFSEITVLPESLKKAHSDQGAALDVEKQFQDLARLDAEAFEKGRALVKRIGDQSNLILDPDLDSYYLMDIVLLRIPELISITRDLELARKAEDEYAIRTQQTLLDSSLESVQDSMGTAFEENSKTAELLKPVFQEFLEAARRYRNSEGTRTATESWLKSLQDFLHPANTELQRLLEARISGFRYEQMLKLVSITIALFISFVVLWRVILSMVRPIRALESRMEDLSQGEGDLTLRLDANQSSEIGRSAGYFNRFAERLSGSIRGIGSVAVSIEDNGNISMGTVDMISTGLQDQAASLEQISAAMEEVSASADRVNSSMDEEKSRLTELQTSMKKLRALSDSLEEQIRNGSNQAQQLAGDAQEGTQEMKNASTEMEAIVRNTREMSTIGVEIQEIAERINLLALNASIEAARAGEYGRGFAVVASEVSRLADRTNESIVRISSMMKENGMRVETSTAVIENAVKRALRMSEGVLELKSALVQVAEELPQQELIQMQTKSNLDMLEDQTELIYSIVSEQKKAIQEASDTIGQINNAAQKHAEASRHLSELSAQNVELASRLKQQTTWFKTE
ncbi:MAG: methyl-accepting chemotaxis protein [Leptospiraceae bacterium]